MVSDATADSMAHYYHVYNRGVDKRKIFLDQSDYARFMQSLIEFNQVPPVGSMYQNSFRDKELRSSTPKLVHIVAYCLNPNHYHLIVRQDKENSLAKYMQRLGTGYTNYFNDKNDRSGALFQGRYKKVLIESDAYLLHLSVYVNLNNKIHQLPDNEFILTTSSWSEYTDQSHPTGICDGKQAVLQHFASLDQYKKYAEKTLPDIVGRKEDTRGLIAA